MDLAAAKTLAETLIAKHAPSWSFDWHSKKRIFGTCDFGNDTIYLSKVLTPFRPEAEVRNTILHELAHVLAGPEHNHSAVWKAWATRIGANPSATAHMSVQSREDLVALGARWILVLPNGEVIKHWFRKPRKNTIDRIPFMYVNGRKEETSGKLTLEKV